MNCITLTAPDPSFWYPNHGHSDGPFASERSCFRLNKDSLTMRITHCTHKDTSYWALCEKGNFNSGNLFHVYCWSAPIKGYMCVCLICFFRASSHVHACVFCRLFNPIFKCCIYLRWNLLLSATVLEYQCFVSFWAVHFRSIWRTVRSSFSCLSTTWFLMNHRSLSAHVAWWSWFVAFKSIPFSVSKRDEKRFASTQSSKKINHRSDQC